MHQSWCERARICERSKGKGKTRARAWAKDRGDSFTAMGRVERKCALTSKSERVMEGRVERDGLAGWLAGWLADRQRQAGRQAERDSMIKSNRQVSKGKTGWRRSGGDNTEGETLRSKAGKENRVRKMNKIRGGRE